MLAESTAVVRRRAPAKINLYLHLTGRRDDGYHFLDSLVVFADIADEVTVRPGSRLDLEVTGTFAGAVSHTDNLVLRAAEVLAKAAGVPAGAHISLNKTLPVAAGIGGGSADAAATLLALMELWDVTLAPEDLSALALSLGADVPACLAGHPLLMSGIGEKLEKAPPLPSCHVVLANPGRELVTAEVFSAHSGRDFSRAEPLTRAPGTAAELARALHERRNDLEKTACGLMTDIGDVLEALRQSPECLLARMSGSGATCFGLFGDKRSAAAAVSAAHESWWVASGAVLGT